MRTRARSPDGRERMVSPVVSETAGVSREEQKRHRGAPRSKPSARVAFRRRRRARARGGRRGVRGGVRGRVRGGARSTQSPQTRDKTLARRRYVPMGDARGRSRVPRRENIQTDPLARATHGLERHDEVRVRGVGARESPEQSARERERVGRKTRLREARRAAPGALAVGPRQPLERERASTKGHADVSRARASRGVSTRGAHMGPHRSVRPTVRPSRRTRDVRPRHRVRVPGKGEWNRSSRRAARSVRRGFGSGARFHISEKEDAVASSTSRISAAAAEPSAASTSESDARRILLGSPPPRSTPGNAAARDRATRVRRRGAPMYSASGPAPTRGIRRRGHARRGSGSEARDSSALDADAISTDSSRSKANARRRPRFGERVARPPSLILPAKRRIRVCSAGSYFRWILVVEDGGGSLPPRERRAPSRVVRRRAAVVPRGSSVVGREHARGVPR